MLRWSHRNLSCCRGLDDMSLHCSCHLFGFVDSASALILRYQFVTRSTQVGVFSILAGPVRDDARSRRARISPSSFLPHSRSHIRKSSSVHLQISKLESRLLEGITNKAFGVCLCVSEIPLFMTHETVWISGLHRVGRTIFQSPSLRYNLEVLDVLKSMLKT